MWKIINESKGQFYHFIIEKPTYAVGRTDSDVILLDDNSISRSHASFGLTSTRNGEVAMNIEDLGSKYGTFVFDKKTKTFKKLPKGVRRQLRDDDEIRFGILKNVWRVKYLPLVGMFTGLTSDETTKLEQHLRSLGVKILSVWDSKCTHLTTKPLITITVKVLYALLHQVPLVTCAYWHDLLEAARLGQAPLPNMEKYMPQHCELMMQKQYNINMKPRPERRHIFAGLTFIFTCKKHQDIFGSIVEMAGGECRNLSNGVQKTFLIKKNVVVVNSMQASQSEGTETITMIGSFLESNNRRFIMDYEIGLAILYCSVEKYCNASYKMNSEFLASMSMGMEDPLIVEDSNATESTDSQVVELFVPETAESDPAKAARDISDVGELVIPETEDDESQAKRKRLLTHDGRNDLSPPLVDVVVDESEEEDDVVVVNRKRPLVIDDDDDDDDNDGDDGTLQSAASAAKPPANKVPKISTENKQEAAMAKELSQPLGDVIIDESEEEDDIVMVKRKRPHVIDDDDNDSEGTTHVDTSKRQRLTADHGKIAQLLDDELQSTSKIAAEKNRRVTRNSRHQPEHVLPAANQRQTRGNISKVSEKSLPVHVNKPNVGPDGFLRKSQRVQPPKDQQLPPPSTENQGRVASRPRVVIPVIDANDDNADDDDDLFNFVDPPDMDGWDAGKSKIPSRNNNVGDYDDQDEEPLFAFTEAVVSGSDAVGKATSANSNAPLVKKLQGSQSCQELAPLPQPKPLPTVISVEGWLKKIKIKDEACDESATDGAAPADVQITVKKEEPSDEDSDSSKWVSSVRGVSIVRKMTVTLVTDPAAATNNSTTMAGDKNGRNSKKFVKQVFVRPQERIALRRMDM